MHRELGFWVAVVCVSIAGTALFKLGAATKVGAALPGYRSLAAFL